MRKSQGSQSGNSAYKQSGYCRLSREDRQSVFRVVGKLDLANKLSKSLIQAINISVNCSFGITDDLMQVFRWLFSSTRTLPQPDREKAVEVFGRATEKNFEHSRQLLAILILGSSSPESTAKLSAMYDSYQWTLGSTYTSFHESCRVRTEHVDLKGFCAMFSQQNKGVKETTIANQVTIQRLDKALNYLNATKSH